MEQETGSKQLKHLKGGGNKEEQICFKAGSKVILLVTWAQGCPQPHKQDLHNWEGSAPVSNQQYKQYGSEIIK